MMKENYGYGFYKDRHQESVYAAKTILTLVLDALPPVKSAIDFGCGVGTWLATLTEMGVSDIQGVDGSLVDQDLLQIPKQNVRQVDFEKEIQLDQRYDLAISLEVAEHLSEASSQHFVEMLTSASDYILFSAAVPFQGGRGHINEQWLDYWVNKFGSVGYRPLDLVRHQIWDDQKIPYWYRQNILCFAKKERAQNIRIPEQSKSDLGVPLAVVHPVLHLTHVQQMYSVSGSWQLFRRALRARIKEKLNLS